MERQEDIKPIGGYIYTDSDGYLINPTSESHITGEWKNLVDDLLEAYIAVYDTNLHSVYLRGSVPRGTMISGTSDLDSFCLVIQDTKEQKEHLSSLIDGIKKKHSFVNGIDDIVLNVNEALNHKTYKFMIKTQSLCVWGKDISSTINKYPVSIDAMDVCLRLNEINKKVHEYSYSERLQDDREAKKYCVWVSRVFLRAAFEVVMLREGKFTRDLYFCWKSYTKHYPMNSLLLDDFLERAINPTADVNGIVKCWEKANSLLQNHVDNSHHLQV